MVNWMDPARIQADAAIFQKIMFVMLGLYCWEIITTLKYDLSIVTGKRPFKYPMIFYFMCRYSLLVAVISINVSLNITSPIDCQALYTINQVAGNVAIGTASTLLALRTVAIWSRNPWVVGPIGILGLGQWAILLHGVITVRSSWSDEASTCVVTGTKPVFLNLIYIYTMTYDLIVLITSCVGLIHTAGRSDLWELLFQDGIIYFVVAFSANLVPTIFLLLNLNPAMNIMTTVPAAIASSIVACRGFVRLSTWAQKDVYIHSQHVVSQHTPRPVTSMGGATRTSTDKPFARGLRLGTNSKFADGVHISMEAYTTADHRGPSPYGDKTDFDEDYDNSGVSSHTATDIEHGVVGYTTATGQPRSMGDPKISFTPQTK